MKTQQMIRFNKRFLIPGAITAFALVASPVVLNGVFDMNMNGVIATAQAASDGKGKGGPGFQGGQGSGGAAATQGSGGKKDSTTRGRRTLDDVLREASDDSDAPPWAGTPGRDGKPGGGNAGGDTKKGGDYGDLFVILRTDDGEPVLVQWIDGVMVVYPGTGSTDGWFVQPLDAAGNPIPLDIEGHVVDETLTQEVELGRLNIARAPTKVLDHSLAEAITKLDGIVITEANIETYTDTAGRIMVDGVAIDSPLENLALYEALVNTAPNAAGDIVITVTATSDGGSTTSTLTVDADVAMQLAAAAFAASADKTGVLTVDGVAYISDFMDVELTAAVDTFTYDREDVYGDETVWILVETSPGIFQPQLVNILDVVTFNTITPIDDDGNGIDTFTQAADDALQVIEYIHDNALE